MTDEPMIEHYDRGWTTDVAPICAVCYTAFPCKTVLLSQLREQEERAERAEAEASDYENLANRAQTRAAAAERTVREQREVIEAAKDAVTDAIKPGRFVYCDNLARCQCSTARLFRSVAALTPDTEGEGT